SIHAAVLTLCRCVMILWSRLLPFCFFFFQAEDGIRDFHVTGVQTCALPILAVVIARLISTFGLDSFDPEAQAALRQAVVELDDRSEERRVGKECRSRWSAHH